MTGLKKKFTSQGITLEQFAFQFVVILLGVYLAVVFEGKAGDRSRRGDADAMLATVLRELALDEQDMEVVLEGKREMARGFASFADLLVNPSQNDEAAIDSLLTGMFDATVFPRRSAYTALLASGDLGYIAERDLSLLLVDLYEHHYVRLANLGVNQRDHHG